MPSASRDPQHALFGGLVGHDHARFRLELLEHLAGQDLGGARAVRGADTPEDPGGGPRRVRITLESRVEIRSVKRREEHHAVEQACK